MDLIVILFNALSWKVSKTNILTPFSYYCYDNPTVLYNQLQEKLEIDELQYNLFYSVYSYPNFIMPLIIGYTVDKVGLNVVTNLVGLCTCLGQGLFVVGAYLESNNGFIWCVFGRGIMGIGSESLALCLTVILARWFKNKEYAFALGLCIGMSCLGTVLNNFTVPPIANNSSLGTACLVGLFFAFFSFLCGVIIILIDMYGTKVDASNNIYIRNELDRVNIKDIWNLGKRFWVASTMAMFLYTAILAFNAVINEFFLAKYNIEDEKAAQITATSYFMSVVAAPIFGILCDKYGLRMSLANFCAFWLVLSYVLFLTIPGCDQCLIGMIPVVTTGIGYSIWIACIWSIFPYIVEEKILGTAYGIATV